MLSKLDHFKLIFLKPNPGGSTRLGLINVTCIIIKPFKILKNKYFLIYSNKKISRKSPLVIICLCGSTVLFTKFDFFFKLIF